MSPFRLVWIFTFALTVMNLLLFCLRSVDISWWSYDFQAYEDVAFNLHLAAFFWFTLYISIFSVLTIKLLRKRSPQVDKANLPKLFIFVVVLHTILAISAIAFNVSVAGALENKLGSIAYIFYFFSFDGVYFAYALCEKNKKRLLFATLIFSLSNIARGWAGFIVYIGFIFFVRHKLSLKMALKLALAFLTVTPVLLYVRDFFRGGIPLDEALGLSGLTGIDFYWAIFINSLEKMLVRFDFYSSYIGISSMSEVDYQVMCIPLTENIGNKILIAVDFGSNCKPLPNILAGHLYQFFKDTGTSFTVASGFFALPILNAAIYLMSYLFVLVISTLIIRRYFNKADYVYFFILLVFFLLFQGWMYQYLYIFSGYIVGLLLVHIKLKFSKISLA